MSGTDPLSLALLPLWPAGLPYSPSAKISPSSFYLVLGAYKAPPRVPSDVNVTPLSQRGLTERLTENSFPVLFLLHSLFFSSPT